MKTTNLKACLSAALLASVCATSASAQLVVNGDFESNGGTGQIGSGISFATGWTSGTPVEQELTSAFNFIVDSNADSTGFRSAIFYYGPHQHLRLGPGQV